MKNNVFIPKKLNVGYQEREDTYSKKLAYVIYWDEKNKLRKEHSWKSWKDDKISVNEFVNEPMEGFVLNRKAGGDSWGWNPRQTYVRVYDPRGFEIEITVPNLLYILETCNSNKGKAIEGSFVYGWDGADLILLSTNAIDYKQMQENSNKLFSNETLKPKELKIGNLYRDKKNNQLVFMGKHITYGSYYRKETKEKFIFFDIGNNTFESRGSVSKFIIEEITKTKYGNYLNILDYFQHQKDFFKIKCKKELFLNKKLLIEGLDSLNLKNNDLERSWSKIININSNYNKNGNNYFRSYGILKDNEYKILIEVGTDWKQQQIEISIEEFLFEYKPFIILDYLHNGKVCYTSGYETLTFDTYTNSIFNEKLS